MDRKILFSSNLKKARLDRQMTQKELGEALDTLFSLCDLLDAGRSGHHGV